MLTQPHHNPNAVRADVLSALDLTAHAAENNARVHRLLGGVVNANRAAHHDQVAKVTRGLHTIASHGLLDRIAAGTTDKPDESYQTIHGEGQYAWHTIRLYRGPALLDPGETDLVEDFHPAQCATLPPGALCWFSHDPRRHWWPAWTAYGTYRLRPFFRLVGGGPDGDDPDVAEGFDIQIWNEATSTWSDWQPPAPGPATNGTDTNATAL